MNWMEVTQGGTTLRFDPKTLIFSIERDGMVWQTARTPYVEFIESYERLPFPKEPAVGVRTVPFSEARTVETKKWKTGLGEGFLTRVEGFEGSSLSFEALLWIDNCYGDLFAELIPYEDPKDEWHRIVFPTAFEFDQPRADWYTLVNMRQGLMLTNDRVQDIARFRQGQYATWLSFMPWFGQVREKDAYIAIGVTEYDGGYLIDQQDSGLKQISSFWMPSLGRISYRRIARYTFLEGDYNDLAAVYRQYSKETGRLVTLKEKAARCENAGRLVGCAWVHEGGYQNTQPDSHYYNHEHPEKNTRIHATFDQRAAQMRALKEKWNLDQVYFHLDGWGVDGYDSHHPDYLPACEKLGGWEGMRRLSDTMQELGYLFATHDQYRDYHYNSESFDEQMAARDTRGDITVHSWWLGGKQTYLCSSQAPGYVRRNYTGLERNGVKIHATYQDVFSMNELDECDHPWHRVTREECARNRRACFDYVMGHGIAVSSEEANDWAMPSLVFCHHAPFVSSLAPEFPKGKPLPLFNLVYHDCFIQPANPVMGPHGNSDLTDGENGLMLALMTGSPAYLPIEPDELAVKRYKLCARLQEATQYSAMTHHEYLTDTLQKVAYENGVTVTIDMATGIADIEGIEGGPIHVDSAEYGVK